MTEFVCPKCGRALVREGKSYFCESGHCFDVAKESYVNLLLPDKKHSKEPGDNALMVRARYDFLGGGFYSPLASALAKECQGAAAVLDAGCGSGYYAEFVGDELPECKVFAVDISKDAVKLGAKRGKAQYAVAGVYDLPFADEAFDAVLNVFSPFAFREYARVLKPHGKLISVYPAAKHLIELKKMLYDEATFENDKDVTSEYFDRIEHRNLQFAAELSHSEDVKNLLAMTPYYYTTAADKIERVRELDGLNVTCDFYIDVFEKL